MAEWIDLLDPDEGALKRALPSQIHARALEQLLDPAVHDDEPRPRLEGHDHYLFGVFLLPVAVREEDRVYYQEIDIVATRDRVVTVRKTPARGDACDLDPVHKAIEGEADKRSGMIVYRVVDLIADDFLDLLASARDYSQAKIANDQNEVVKRLTVIASLLLVPTFIVGLYGQNFDNIPELKWGFGYWWSWGWIVFTTILQLAFFRWLGWIGGDKIGRAQLPPLLRLDPRALRGRRRRTTST